ncbi:MAG: glycosyltransferase [Ignavibacteria bacterium]|nr:glycosyltransferase [Ignavibacteria bacterium]
MLYFQISVLVFLTSFLLIFLWNLFITRIKKIPAIDASKFPLVSILIPARNEEHNISQCVESLFKQDYPQYEVIVLNDHSTDRTGLILSELQNKFPELKIINGAELPEGWIGKSFACHQLTQTAKGDWLLFTDADTIHNSNSIRTGIETALVRNADLLSVVPYQITMTLSEKLVIPILHFVTFSLLPFYFLEKRGFKQFTIAVGQYMLFKKSSLEKIGGYEAVKNEIVEDVSMGKLIKKNNMQLIVLNGIEMVSCRMYRNFAQVWEGFSKNIFAGLGFSFITMSLIIISYFIFFILPYYWTLYFLFTQGFSLLSLICLAQISINYFIRFTLSFKYKLSFTSSILHPFGILTVILITLNSWRLVAFSSGPSWKGRSYKLK